MKGTRMSNRQKANREARARVRAEIIRTIPWLKSYTNSELDFELTRRRNWPPSSVEIGIGYWEETNVDQLLEELTATSVDEESLVFAARACHPAPVTMVDQSGHEHQVSITRPHTWAVRAWREWELQLALRQRERNPNAIFRRVIHTMELDEFYKLQSLHQNNPAARH
jgi:hypothetical protein